MRSLLLTISLILLSVGIISAQPSLEIAGNEFDFGLVPQNSTVTQFFWFHSTGTDTLRIREIKTGCSCALMPLERNWIAPGDSLKVGIFWNTRRRVGNIGRYPYIFTNASKDPYRILLTATAQHTLDSKNLLSVLPYKWELAVTATKAIDSLSFTLENFTDKDLSIEILANPFLEGRVMMPDRVKAHSKKSGYVIVADEYKDAEFERSITIRLDDRNNTIMSIPIRRKFY